MASSQRGRGADRGDFDSDRANRKPDNRNDGVRGYKSQDATPRGEQGGGRVSRALTEAKTEVIAAVALAEILGSGKPHAMAGDDPQEHFCQRGLREFEIGAYKSRAA
jgi:hypothetical protein